MKDAHDTIFDALRDACIAKGSGSRIARVVVPVSLYRQWRDEGFRGSNAEGTALRGVPLVVRESLPAPVVEFASP